MLRYLHRLEARDLSLTTSMIPLGSCTMKLNATSEMLPVTWPEFGAHPPLRARRPDAAATRRCSRSSRPGSREITGFPAVSLQPNAGSQGEYAGLLAIRRYHASRGETERDVCLIPVSAHGTNPASAVIAGFRCVAVACDERGNIDVADLRAQGGEHTRPARRADDHLPVDPRRVRGVGPGDLRHRPRARRPGLHGRRQHERPGRPHVARRRSAPTSAT